tara:strand:- start:1688 stop:2497 length:810 start_codon:yes stop_codon:yes gene_type:complete
MLYVVASPIGNLEDITFRAVRILEEVDIVLCEDTRVTKKLLDHYNISKPLFRYIDDDSKQNYYLEKIKSNDVALVSDAGTPLLSDPGYKLVKIARDSGIKVSPIPGVSSLMTAISVTGKEINNFLFDGFFPRLNSDQKILLSKLKFRSQDTFLFESPKRINKTLKLLKDTLVHRTIFIFHELTKLHEKIIKIDLDKKNDFDFIDKGEYVILVEGIETEKLYIDDEFTQYVKLEIEFMLQKGLSLKNATKIISEIFDLPRKDIYNIWIDK